MHRFKSYCNRQKISKITKNIDEIEQLQLLYFQFFKNNSSIQGQLRSNIDQNEDENFQNLLIHMLNKRSDLR